MFIYARRNENDCDVALHRTPKGVRAYIRTAAINMAPLEGWRGSFMNDRAAERSASPAPVQRA